MKELIIAQAVKEAAQVFTNNNQLLKVSDPSYPLAVYEDGYVKLDLGQNYKSEEAMTASVEEHFEEVNQEPNEIVEDERGAIVGNIHAAIASIQYNSHNVIIPAIKSLTETYLEKQNSAGQANVRVEPYIFDPIHSEPTLTEHLFGRYENLRPLPEYRSFILKPMDMGDIIELISNNNPHLGQQQVTEWALKIPVEKIENVWNDLFGRTRMLNTLELRFLNTNNFPFNIDEVALAYFLTGALIDEPQEVPGYSVDLEEWEKVLRLQHEMFGHYLLQAYQSRAHDVDSGTLVYKYNSSDAINTTNVEVIINNTVADEWFRNGGKVEAILGAAVSGGDLYIVSDFDDHADTMVKRWNTIYPLIKQSALDKAERNRRIDITNTFIDQCMGGLNGEDNPQEEGPFHAVIQETMRSTSTADLDNPYGVFARLLCNVFYPDTSHLEYLDTINHYGEMFPEATLRELSTQSLIALVAMFLAKQIKVELVSSDPDTVVEDPVDETEEAEGELETEEVEETEDELETEGEEPEVEDDDLELETEESEEEELEEEM